MSSTLLQLVNRVLLDVGERQVTSISNSVSRKAKLYIQDALNDLQMFHNWEWLSEFSGVSTFTNEKTTITNLRRIRTVFWNTGSTFVKIPWIPLEGFVERELEPFDSTVDTSTCPHWYTQEDDVTIALNPYPTDSEGRDRIRVEGIKYIESPENDSDLIPIPERFENILVKRAVYNMYMRHLGELDLANAMNFEFTDILQRFRDQENRTPMRGTNMYQGRRGVERRW